MFKGQQITQLLKPQICYLTVLLDIRYKKCVI